jgi:hypothetical protein
MTVQYQISSTDEFEGITLIFSDGSVATADASHPNYRLIEDAVRGKTYDDDSALLALINPVIDVSNKLLALSERVTFNGAEILFDGDVLENALTEHIVRLITESDTTQDRDTGYAHFVKFLEKLQTNPSKKSRKHLFHFVERNGITITETGDMLLYKGVNSDLTSKHAGYGIVNGVLFEKANLDNSVGNVVEIPRSMVDDNRNVACSKGLHAGDYSYASDFANGGVLLRVLVNPRDVVSVPSDSADRKVRISRYSVLEQNPDNYTKPTIVLQPEPSREEVLEEILDAIEGEVEVTGEVTIVPQDVAGALPGEEPQVLLGVVLPPVQASALDFAQRVDKMETLLRSLTDTTGKALRRLRNKKITRKNREPFDLAVANLGLSYDN